MRWYFIQLTTLFEVFLAHHDAFANSRLKSRSSISMVWLLRWMMFVSLLEMVRSTSNPTSQPSRQPTSQPTLQPSAALPSSLRDGLVAYYPFDGNANDNSGNNNDGVVHGATLTTDRFGFANKAYSFDGSSSYIQLPGADFDFVNNMTISLWLNPASSQVSHTGLLHRVSVNGGWYVEQINVPAVNNVFYFGYEIAYNVLSDPSFGATGNSVQTIAGVWNHLIITKKNEIVNYYLNAVLVNTFTGPSAIIKSTSLPVLIGAENSDGTTPPSNINRYFSGFIDDLFFYNRTLSASEIIELYNFDVPTSQPSGQPSRQPTGQPSQQPTFQPTSQPTASLPSSLRDGLVAYYPFDGNANDESGNSNNGVVYSATLTTDRFGFPDKAYSFDGSSSYIVVNNGDSFDFTDAISISLWVKPGIQNYLATLMDKNHNAGGAWTIEQVDLEQNYYRFIYWAVSYDWWEPSLSHGTQLLVNKWNHYVITKENSTVRSYLNGDLVFILNGLDKTIGTNGNLPLCIGANNGTDNYFNGTIDDIFIYNRTLLTSEIFQLYNFDVPTSQPSQQPTFQPTSQPTASLPSSLRDGLVAYYPFDGNANDNSGNNNDGVVHSATLTTDRFGFANKAYSFDGSSSYIEIIDGSSFNFVSDFSVAFWANPVVVSTDSIPHILTNGGVIYFEIHRDDNNNFYAGYYDKSNTFQSAGVSRLNSNAWNHFVFTKNGKVVKYYLNNLLGGVNNATVSSVASSGNKPFIIGAYNGAQTQPASQVNGFYHGYLDEIYVYNRTLSSAEIFQLYNFDVPTSQPTCQPTSLPSNQPTRKPSRYPSSQPSRQPSVLPTSQPSGLPSDQPSNRPSRQPTNKPSAQPSARPSRWPTSQPSGLPSDQPSRMPTNQPSGQPSSKPSGQPSCVPTLVSANIETNLLANPGAEIASTAGWSLYHSCGFVSNSRKFTGQYSFGFDSCGGTQYTGMYQTVRLVIGNNYTASAWIAGLSTTTVTISVDNQTYVSRTGFPGQSTFVHLVSSSFRALQSEVLFSINIFQNPYNGAVFVDDIALTGLIAPTAMPTYQPSGRPSSQPSRQPSRLPTSQPNRYPSSQPSRQPTNQPSVQPSTKPSRWPTSQPSAKPSRIPSIRPSIQPSRQPTLSPSSQPTRKPSRYPSSQPSRQPSAFPTTQPSRWPSGQPSNRPSRQPTNQPSVQPSTKPSRWPTSQPSAKPSRIPSVHPSSQPSRRPSVLPTSQPSRLPSAEPSNRPSRRPTNQPSVQPSTRPSRWPTNQPSAKPSRIPSIRPSTQPSRQPTSWPSSQPTSKPSRLPSAQPSNLPSGQPTNQPSVQPSRRPTSQPSSTSTTRPTRYPSSCPSGQPSIQPSRVPSARPSVKPSVRPSRWPTNQPSAKPSRIPSIFPSIKPSCAPSSQPTRQPILTPSNKPTSQPTSRPSRQPSVKPSLQPSSQPSTRPSRQPSVQPTHRPSLRPSIRPSTWPTNVPWSSPTSRPSQQPSVQSTAQPSVRPSSRPTARPSFQPTGQPSYQPSKAPTSSPSYQPTSRPTHDPTAQPSPQPSIQPSRFPTHQPVGVPSGWPTRMPLSLPTLRPTLQPQANPTNYPTGVPTIWPSAQPSWSPSAQPSRQPSRRPSRQPSGQPSKWPSRQPSLQPTGQPSGYFTSPIMFNWTKTYDVSPTSTATSFHVKALGYYFYFVVDNQLTQCNALGNMDVIAKLPTSPIQTEIFNNDLLFLSSSVVGRYDLKGNRVNWLQQININNQFAAMCANMDSNNITLVGAATGTGLVATLNEQSLENNYAALYAIYNVISFQIIRLMAADNTFNLLIGSGVYKDIYNNNAYINIILLSVQLAFPGDIFTIFGIQLNNALSYDVKDASILLELQDGIAGGIIGSYASTAGESNLAFFMTFGLSMSQSVFLFYSDTFCCNRLSKFTALQRQDLQIYMTGFIQESVQNNDFMIAHFNISSERYDVFQLMGINNENVIDAHFVVTQQGIRANFLATSLGKKYIKTFYVDQSAAAFPGIAPKGYQWNDITDQFSYCYSQWRSRIILGTGPSMQKISTDILRDLSPTVMPTSPSPTRPGQPLSKGPTRMPSLSFRPTINPTKPSPLPTRLPTMPTSLPSALPSFAEGHSASPTLSQKPTTSSPSTGMPTTLSPTEEPSVIPTTSSPSTTSPSTSKPTRGPTMHPTTAKPSFLSTAHPSKSGVPSEAPTSYPTHESVSQSDASSNRLATLALLVVFGSMCVCLGAVGVLAFWKNGEEPAQNKELSEKEKEPLIVESGEELKMEDSLSFCSTNASFFLQEDENVSEKFSMEDNDLYQHGSDDESDESLSEIIFKANP